MQKKYIGILLLFLGLGALALSYFKKPIEKDENVLTIGIATGYAPYVSLNMQGEYEGFDIDLAHEIGKQMNKKIVFKDYGSMIPLFLALQQKQIDAIMWGLSITSDRLKKVAMIPYQVEKTTHYPLLFWKKIPAGIQSLSDMDGLMIDVEPGSTQEKLLDKYPGIVKKPVEKITDAILDLQYGSPDIGSGKPVAVLVEPAVANKLKQKCKDLISLDVELPQDLQEFGVGIAIRQDNAELYRDLFYALSALKRDKVIKQLEKKWGLVCLPQ